MLRLLMKLLFTSVLLCTAITCQAQIIEIGYGPLSDKGLGDLPNTAKFNISLLYPAYKSPAVLYVPGVRYSRVDSKNTQLRDDTNTKVNGTFNLLFLIPAAFNFPIGKFAVLTRFGYGFSTKYFPNKNGFPRNFLLETGVKYAITRLFSVSLRYSHVSNGGFGKINPGVDNIEMDVGFYF
jgi:hypothetical protein